MKILSYQPFSVYANGGGSRILRRLYEGHESEVSSLVVSFHNYSSPSGEIPERIVHTFPRLDSWMKWRLRDMIIWLQNNAFRSLTINHIRKVAAQIPHDVIHVVNHGPFSSALCDDQILLKKSLWVSFHDHFSTSGSSFDDANKLWNLANRRLVISENLGVEYKRLFGDKPYEVITDGLTESEISDQSVVPTMPITVYFAGLLHLDYLPLFKVLADVLDQMPEKGYSFKLILRGTQKVEFLQNRKFDVEFRPMTLNNEELKAEMDLATILYLPIKFSVPDFYLYSLSTKMVGYLGAPGSILYNGPNDSAACKLLQKENSAVCCGSLDISDMENALIQTLTRGDDISKNAKILARKQFGLKGIQNRFWETSIKLINNG